MSLRIAMAAAGVAALALTACSSSKGANPQAPTGSTGRPASGVTISVAGGVLVGPDGRTLYFNTVDTASSIKCTGACTKEWPPIGGPAQASGGVQSSDLGVATRPDGSVQTTFQGHPLYMFDEDKKAGDHKGDGLDDAGGKWHVATLTAAGGGASEAPTTSPPVLSGSASASGGYTY